jgi:hypothetical protein
MSEENVAGDDRIRGVFSWIGIFGSSFKRNRPAAVSGPPPGPSIQRIVAAAALFSELTRRLDAETGE